MAGLVCALSDDCASSGLWDRASDRLAPCPRGVALRDSMPTMTHKLAAQSSIGQRLRVRLPAAKLLLMECDTQGEAAPGREVRLTASSTRVPLTDPSASSCAVPRGDGIRHGRAVREFRPHHVPLAPSPSQGLHGLEPVEAARRDPRLSTCTCSTQRALPMGRYYVVVEGKGGARRARSPRVADLYRRPHSAEKPRIARRLASSPAQLGWCIARFLDPTRHGP